MHRWASHPSGKHVSQQVVFLKRIVIYLTPSTGCTLKHISVLAELIICV